MNEHKGMELKNIWFKRGEFSKLVNAVNCNCKDEAFDILFEIKQRGDLK
jgi:hypothetical protein